MKKIFAVLFTVCICTELFAGIHAEVDKLILKKDFKAAEEMAEAAVKKNPRDPESLCALACVYRNMAYKEGIQFNSSAAGIKEGENGSGDLSKDNLNKIFSPVPFYEKETFAKAEKIYYEIIKLNKNYENAYFNLLNAYAVMREFDPYFRVIDLYIKNMGEQKNTRYSLNDLAGKLFKGANYDEAIKLYKKISKHYPDYSHPVSDLGALYFKVGKIEKANHMFLKAWQIDANDKINSGNLARSYIYLEDFKSAYKYYTILCKEDEKEIFNLYTTGMLGYIAKKDYKAYFNNFIQKRSSQVKNPEKDFWIFSASKFIEIDSMKDADRKEILAYLLDTYRKNSLSTFVIMTGNIVLEKAPDSFALVLIASVYDGLHFNSKTIEYLKKIEKHKKIDSKIMSETNLNFNYGINYYSLGEYDTSLEYLKKIKGDEDRRAAVNYYMGMIYIKRRNLKLAKEYFGLNSKMKNKEDIYFINESIRELRVIESNKK